MENKILIFGHQNPDTDSICSSIVMEKFNKNLGKEAEAVRLGNINKETQYVLNYLEIQAPRKIEEVKEGQRVILVDHNEFNQSAKGIENAIIETVIDHHKIANFQTKEPLYYRAEPIGCTASILYKKFKEENMKIEKTEAILMLSAIISDTLLFKSPTCTSEDKKACEELGKIAEIDINKYGLEMLKAGTDLDDLTADELINLDAKSLSKDDVKYVIAQVNTVSIEDVLKKEEQIKNAIKKSIEEKGLGLFVFAITDILNSNSEIIAMGSKANIIKSAFGKELNGDKAFLEGVVSRKKQLIPNIEKVNFGDIL